jgi:hypothetical protein
VERTREERLVFVFIAVGFLNYFAKRKSRKLVPYSVSFAPFKVSDIGAKVPLAYSQQILIIRKEKAIYFQLLLCNSTTTRAPHPGRPAERE